MRPLFDLRRVKHGNVHDYRLFGPEGSCRLSTSLKHALYVPASEIRTPEGAVAARIKRGKLLNFDILVSNDDGSSRFRIAIPRIQTMFRKDPFIIIGPQDERLYQLMPHSTWKESIGGTSTVWDTINDDDLVLLRGEEVLAHTSHAGEAHPPSPTVAKVAANLARLPFEIGTFVYNEVTGANAGKEIASGALRLARNDIDLDAVLVMTILLFRRFDYHAMRRVD